MVIAIDPGPEQSAFLCWDGAKVLHGSIQPNAMVLNYLQSATRQGIDEIAKLVIEKVASFGMPVGAEVFETVYWSGRFAQAYGIEQVERLTRHEIKLHLCNSARAKDANVRQALLDRFGGKEKAIGKKHSPGPLYSVKSHLWSALAVAITYWDKQSLEAK